MNLNPQAFQSFILCLLKTILFYLKINRINLLCWKKKFPSKFEIFESSETRETGLMELN